MDGIITNFRQGRHTQYTNQMIVQVKGAESKAEVEKLVGKTTVWNSGKKDIKGEIRSAHGNNGCVRVLFETGMPGQAVGKKVKIE
ncbi:MAG: 50S ribosomal protein L35ae [Nanoarchaeota archaeon]|nr:50S ribosomal protein L35ae [Nanoarchaeota archaeon]MBU1029728.1 50S ribosomal protein L35ae [Nanoarchaeota archaeon]MBU1849173.1 50S ribosomal protein L35ae [Nanoarchaeota archaeon]